MSIKIVILVLIFSFPCREESFPRPSGSPHASSVLHVSNWMIWRNKLRFFFFSETDRTKYKFKDAVKILKDRNFDNQKKTVIYIHGFLEGLFAESVKAVVKTYIDRKDHNVIILDWHTQASPEYFLNAVQNVYKVSIGWYGQRIVSWKWRNMQ